MQLAALCKVYPVLSVSGRPPSTDAAAGQLIKQITSIEYDSRYAAPGALFFCLPGSRMDGHTFAPAAYEAGCRAFVCTHLLDTIPQDAVQIIVDDPRRALAFYSAAFYDYPADKLTVIGITGTKGKTTTAILLAEILSGCGIPCAYIGSNGVVIGEEHFETVNTTPESRELHRYFRMMIDHGITHVVMEVSSQALITHRVEGIPFDTCLYTNLSVDHIGGVEHPTFDDYLAAKARLFHEYAPAHIVCNLDDAHWAEVVGMPGKNVDFVGFGVHQPISEHCRFIAKNIRPFRSETALGIDFTCTDKNGDSPIRLRTPGEFSVYNGLCAIAAASVYGVTVADAARILQTLSIRGRFEIVDALPGVTFILDYAHNGLSLASALRVLREYHPHRLICLFGSVGCRTQNRRRELGEAAGKYADYAIITADNPDTESPDAINREILSYYDRTKPYLLFDDREDALRAAVRMAEDGDIVLCAGKGHETYQLINGEKRPFSEREIILHEAALRTEILPVY